MMGYTCLKCFRWINDNEIHGCTDNAQPGYWNNIYYYPYYMPTQSNSNHKCSKVECIYHPGEDWLSKDRCKACGNLSIVIDEFGQCISFVKKKKETEK